MMFSCVHCGADVHPARVELLLSDARPVLCLDCGEHAATAARRSWTVVQQYGKGPYQFVTRDAAFLTLRQTNQKQLRG